MWTRTPELPTPAGPAAAIAVRLLATALLATALLVPRVAAAQEPGDEQETLVSLQPGEGLRVARSDERFSLRLRGLLQLWLVGEERAPTADEDYTVDPRLRRARLIVDGTFFSPDNHLVLQLGFSPQDLQVMQSIRTDDGTLRYTPIVDAYLQFTQLRDLRVTVGRQLLPFIRERVVSSAAMSLPERSLAGQAFDLGRLYGVELGSDDFLGLRRLAYRAGAYLRGMDDATKPVSATVGGRVMAHLLLPPDLAVQGDLDRSPSPRLSVGAAYAWLDGGAPMPELLERDLHLVTGDVVFRVLGLAIEGAVMFRRSVHDVPLPTAPRPVRELGGYAMAGYLLPWLDLEVVARWSQLWDRELDESAEREITGGLGYYFVGAHAFKLQLSVTHRERRDPAVDQGWRGILHLQGAL